MKRCWFGLGLLILLLAAGLATMGMVTRSHSEISGILNRAGAAAAAEDWITAENYLRDARQRWREDWHITAALADHEPMEEIDGFFAQAEVYLAYRDGESLAAICAQLACMAEAVGEAHALNWWNLL